MAYRDSLAAMPLQNAVVAVINNRTAAYAAHPQVKQVLVNATELLNEMWRKAYSQEPATKQDLSNYQMVKSEIQSAANNQSVAAKSRDAVDGYGWLLDQVFAQIQAAPEEAPVSMPQDTPLPQDSGSTGSTSMVPQGGGQTPAFALPQAKGLSTGVKIGIAVGVLALVGGLIAYLVKRRRG